MCPQIDFTISIPMFTPSYSNISNINHIFYINQNFRFSTVQQLKTLSSVIFLASTTTIAAINANIFAATTRRILLIPFIISRVYWDLYQNLTFLPLLTGRLSTNVRKPLSFLLTNIAEVSILQLCL